MTGHNKVILSFVLLPWFTFFCAKSTATPHVTLETGGSDGRHNARVRMVMEGKPSQEQQNAIPPRFYRALSRRSVGRYVLGTSSVVAECARVYAPAPLGSVASSLCNRFNRSLASHGGEPRPLSTQKKSPGVSYALFMSQEDRTVEDDGDGDGDLVGSLVPPKKYSRVSSSFLMRHGIGLERADKDSCEEDNELLQTPVFEARERPDSQRRKEAVRLTQLKTRNVFKSFVGLGRQGTVGLGDDLELLSDAEEDRERNSLGERGEMSSRVGLAASKMSVGAADEDVMDGKSTFRRQRNLVDKGSADCSTLLKKIRLAEKADGVSRSRRKKGRRRRSRRSSSRMDKTT